MKLREQIQLLTDVPSPDLSPQRTESAFNEKQQSVGLCSSLSPNGF